MFVWSGADEGAVGPLVCQDRYVAGAPRQLDIEVPNNRTVGVAYLARCRKRK